MDKLEQYRVFIRVAELGSFIRAAHILELPRASVSAAILQLETQVGTRLLHRTTRKVGLTADGRQFLEKVRQLLADADELNQLFHTQQQQVVGRLNVDVPSRIARRLIAPALPSLFRRYPHLQLQLGSTDRFINLVKEGVDCAVRVGELQDSSLVVRPLGQIAMINCASPAYLAEYGVPEQPDQLTQHWSIGYASPSSGRTLPWEYQMEEECIELEVPSRVIVNNAENYIASCVAGLGLIQIPRFDVQHLLDAEQLVEIMPGHRPASMPIAFVYPHRRQRSRRLNAFCDWFEQLIKPHLQ